MIAGTTMKKKRRVDLRLQEIESASVDDRIITSEVEPIELVETIAETPITEVVINTMPEPKPRRYVPPKCSMCTALRPSGTDYTEVYRTRYDDGYTVRHCKCGFCGNTFKHISR